MSDVWIMNVNYSVLCGSLIHSQTLLTTCSAKVNIHRFLLHHCAACVQWGIKRCNKSVVNKTKQNKRYILFYTQDVSVIIMLRRFAACLVLCHTCWICSFSKQCVVFVSSEKVRRTFKMCSASGDILTNKLTNQETWTSKAERGKISMSTFNCLTPWVFQGVQFDE